MNCRACRRRVFEVGPGEPSICSVCGDVSIATEDGRLRRPTEHELDRVRTSIDYRMAMAVIEDFDKPLVEG